jgi:hypothetical protein
VSVMVGQTSRRRTEKKRHTKQHVWEDRGLGTTPLRTCCCQWIENAEDATVDVDDSQKEDEEEGAGPECGDAWGEQVVAVLAAATVVEEHVAR